jgi:16S rRNA (guanine1516-N2)-methyltransferase
MNTPTQVDITYKPPHLALQAQALAEELGLPLNPVLHSPSTPFSLVYTESYLGLADNTTPSSSLFFIDFLSKSWRYRIRKATINNEFVAKAMGSAPKNNPRILDLTAGLGRDSFILAALHYHVTLLERSPIVFALLRDALQRASHDPEYRLITERMHLIHADALDYLPGKTADIIYLDPMFPARNKRALVKKELLILQSLLGHDPDSERLLPLAISCAAKRVVVKRPRLAEPLGQLPPQFSYDGKSSRFDIYLTPPKAGAP